MYKEFNNKVILITGGSRGIGATLVKSFASYGAKIIFTYSKKNTHLETIKTCSNLKGSVEGFEINHFNMDDNTKLINYIQEKYTSLDFLINNAAIDHYSLLMDEQTFLINKVITTNLSSPIDLSSKAIKIMNKNSYSSIINISSIWGIYGASFEAVYSASKGGLISFTKSLAREYENTKIRCNCIAPGAVETNMLLEFSSQELQDIAASNYLGRISKKEDISNIALFLASSQSKSINGAVIEASGMLK